MLRGGKGAWSDCRGRWGADARFPRCGAGGRMDSGVRSGIPFTGIPMSDTTGEPSDVSVVFDRYKERLRRTVRLRLDRRLTGIVDSSGVLEMAREEVQRRGAEPEPAAVAIGSFLWLRQIVGEVLPRLHQERLGPDVRGDISLYRGALPEATSVSLAAHLLGKAAARTTGPPPAPSRSSCSRRPSTPWTRSTAKS